MPTYTQSNRYIKVTTPLGEDVLLLTGLRGHETLSQLFSFQLDLLAERSATVSFERLLGRPATVELLHGGQKRYFNGIIKCFRQGLQDDIFTHFHAELVPHFWLWTKRMHCRVFQHQSVPDILKTVLDGLDVSFAQLHGQYPTHNYCVQYRESDFAFACRLMEEEGIYYYFEHTANGHKMILADNSSHSPDLPHQARLNFDQGEGGVRPEQRIDRWEKSQQLCSGKYTLWDHHFELPGQYLAAEQSIPAQATAGKVRHSLQVGDNDKLDLFDYPGEFAHRFDGINSWGVDQQADLQKVFEDNQRTARLRMEEEASSGLWIEGGGTYRQMTPGHKFTLSRHFNGDGPYVLTRVEHQAAIHGDYATQEETTLVYSNSFRCLPLDLPYRPPRVTPRPVVHGLQTATVIGPSQGSVGYTGESNAAVGPAGDDIFCDRYGRVKVQFRWDRENKYSAGSSCWVRVNQAWAGQQWGMITLPRVGQEVVVAFVEGDPDRPLILGSVYNAAQMPPFPLPAAKTQAGIKAHSQGHGANSQTFSGLGFETAIGEEHVHLHGERYMTHSAEQTLYVNAGQEHHVNVGKVASRQVGGLPGINHTLTHGKPTQLSSSPPSPSPSSASPPPSPPPSGGPHGWNPEIAGFLGWDLDLTLGWAEANVIGLNTKPTIGQTITSNITPAGFFAAFGVPLPMAGAATGFLNAVGLPLVTLTNATVNMGNSLTFQFGSTLTVGSGYRLEANNSPATWKATPGTGALAALYTAITVADILVPPLLPVNYKSVMNNVAVMAGGTGALELILNIWSYVEGYYAGIAKTNQDNEDAEKAAVIKTLQWNSTYARETLLVLNQDILTLSRETSDALSATTKMDDSWYSIRSPVIELLSNPYFTNLTGLSQIKLTALGSTQSEGDVTIYASGMTHLSGGAAAYLSMATAADTNGTIVLDCGAAGTLTMQSGPTQEPNCLTMKPEGIGFSSLVKMSLQVTEDNTVLMEPDGIALKAGASSITLTDEGITLNCGGKGIQITAEGVTITGTTVAVNSTTLNLGGTTVNVVGDEIIIG